MGRFGVVAVRWHTRASRIKGFNKLPFSFALCSQFPFALPVLNGQVPLCKNLTVLQDPRKGFNEHKKLFLL